jgi:mRNA-degrading endonuclease RelE of RelBE toxin-antitoxin system
MKVEFLSTFNKDLNKLSSPFIRKSLKTLILKLESSESLAAVPNVKKLAGHKHIYRIRLGDYRVGFFFENNTIQLARIAHRKDIYKIFP